MKTEQNGIIGDRFFKYGIILSLFIIGIGIYKIISKAPTNYISNHLQPSFSEKSVKIFKEKPEFQEIQIPDKGLSKLVEIPPGRCFWIHNNPGWLEYWFLTGKGYIKTFTAIAGEEKLYPGIFPSRKFKLKGQPGTAKIWLEPCRKNF